MHDFLALLLDLIIWQFIATLPISLISRNYNQSADLLLSLICDNCDNCDKDDNDRLLAGR